MMYAYVFQIELKLNCYTAVCIIFKFYKNMSITRTLFINHKKSLKIPKRSSEGVNRRTDNTMAKRKRTK